MKLRKTIAILLASLLALTLAMTSAGCSDAGKTDADVIRIGGLKGPTSIGLVKLMEDNENNASVNNYDFTVAGSADELTPLLVKGELDMAAIPANLASVIYNKTEGAVQVLAVNTLGVVYIVEKGSAVNSIADLKGKTIYATGKGSTPEYTMRYILSQNGLDPDKDVTFEWKSEPTEVVALLIAGSGGIAMMPQPYVTVAQGSVEGLRIALDLTAEWNKLNSGSQLITGTLVVRKDFAEQHPLAIKSFLKEYKESTEYVNANVADAALMVEKFGIFKAAVAEKAIPYCNITFISGEEMVTSLSGYLRVLYDANPASVGGNIDYTDFFYVADE